MIKGFSKNQSTVWTFVCVAFVCVGILSCNWVENDQFIAVEEIEPNADYDTNELVEEDKSDLHAISTRTLSIRLQSCQNQFISRRINITQYITLPTDLIRIHHFKTGPPTSLAMATDAGAFSGHVAKEAIDAETDSIQT